MEIQNFNIRDDEANRGRPPLRLNRPFNPSSQNDPRGLPAGVLPVNQQPNSAQTIHVNEIRNERPTVPYFFRFNVSSQEYNISVYLNFMLQMTFFVSIYQYSLGNSYQWLLVPAGLDFFLSIIAAYIHTEYSSYFGLHGSHSTSNALSAAILSMVLRLVIMLFIYLSIDHPGRKWIPYFALFFSLCVLLVQNSVFILRPCYSTFFNFQNLVTLCLFLFKFHYGTQMSWNWVFITYLIMGWVVFAACCILGLFLLVLSLVSFLKGEILNGIGFLLGLLMVSFLFFFAPVCFSMPKHMVGERNWMGLSLEDSIKWLILFSSIGFFLRVLSSCLPQQQHQGERAGPRGVREESGINRVLNIVQINPNFFGNAAQANNNEGESLVGEDRTEPVDCMVCFTPLVGNCLIFPCFHAGICKDCAKNIIKTNAQCPLCRKPISKIAVIEKINNHEYKILEEVIPI